MCESICLLAETPINLLLENEMSFSKINLCESTQVAFNLFHMLRNGTVNMVESDDEEGSFYRYEDPSPLSEGKVRPFDNEKLDRIADLLMDDCTEARVHDVVESDARSIQRRLVQFYVHKRAWRRTKTIVNITVGREYLDGEEASGWTAWKVKLVQLTEVVATNRNSTEGQGYTEVLRMRPWRLSWEDARLSPLMREAVGGFLHFF
jgi:hypothetical protein